MDEAVSIWEAGSLSVLAMEVFSSAISVPGRDLVQNKYLLNKWMSEIKNLSMAGVLGLCVLKRGMVNYKMS